MVLLDNPIISIRGLDKTFATKEGSVAALSGIDLDIYAGEVFGIIGMSGAGKSTLVRCINFLERPTSGKIEFDGRDMAALSPAELRQARLSMGMIFQQFNLLMQRSVLKNVLFPLEVAKVPRDQARSRVKELLDIVGLADKADNFPSQLSGGQKQRVAIARALATNPKVLLCDEATSALDPTTTRSILELLRDINSSMGITIVVITHEMSVIEEICSRVAIIDQSGIAEVGRVIDIFSKPESEAGRRLVYPEERQIGKMIGQRCLRIVFDGNSSFEPVIANMVMDCKQTVNIIFADTKNLDGLAYGQIVIQLPEDKRTAEKIILYLRARNLKVEEVGGYV